MAIQWWFGILSCVSYLKGQELVWSTFREVGVRHLDSGSAPGGLEELHHGAELWAFNTDFSLEFPQPLMPYTVLVGGLLNKPAKPLEQVSLLDTHDKHISETFLLFSNELLPLSLPLPIPLPSGILFFPTHKHLSSCTVKNIFLIDYWLIIAVNS